MTTHRNALILVAVAVLAATSISPSFAKPNDGRYQKSLEAARKSFCSDLKLALDTVEKAADDRSGTKEAKPYAEEADKLWAQGERAGCSWTA
jgi:hypothetical protein